MFTPYANRSGRSGVSAYKINLASIEVKFNTGRVYTYSVTSAGPVHLAQLKKLARSGYGLNSYIMRYCKKLYV